MIRDASRQRRRHTANAVLVAALAGCAALLLWPPGQRGFYPVCPIHQWFGIECPGCGATRALAALLHGRVMEALRLNTLFVVLLPCALAFAVETYRRALRAGVFRWPQPPAGTVYVTLVAAVLFTAARNLR